MPLSYFNCWRQDDLRYVLSLLRMSTKFGAVYGRGDYLGMKLYVWKWRLILFNNQWAQHWMIWRQQSTTGILVWERSISFYEEEIMYSQTLTFLWLFESYCYNSYKSSCFFMMRGNVQIEFQHFTYCINQTQIKW